jgi:hypothetical protein
MPLFKSDPYWIQLNSARKKSQIFKETINGVIVKRLNLLELMATMRQLMLRAMPSTVIIK